MSLPLPRPAGLPSSGAQQAKRPSWRQGRYYSNSGIHNAVHVAAAEPRGTQLPHLSSSRSLQALTDKATSDTMAIQKSVPYTVSYESKQQADIELSKQSMINFQHSHYNPITHVEMAPRTTMTAHRQKSIAQFIDKARSFCPNASQEFVKTAQTTARAFHKTSGQFTRFNDLCVRSAKLPFEVPASLGNTQK